MQEEEASAVSSDGTRLAGTLTLPDCDPMSMVVMIHGTGPLDRDENAGKKAGRLDIFNVLARDLAAAGHASLRYDKRGCGTSGGHYLIHDQADLIADVRAWIDVARNRGFGRPGAAPVFLLGHSEGTIIAPRAAEGRDDVAGLVLICPFVQPVEEMLLAQATQLGRDAKEMPGIGGALWRAVLWLAGGAEAAQRRIVARIRATEAPVIRVLGRREPARSLRDLLALDNRAIHAANRLPTFLLVAGKDVQCAPEDGAEIAALNPNAELLEIGDLTHILRRDAGPPSFSAYTEQLKRPIDPAVSAAVVDWLGRNSGTGARRSLGAGPNDRRGRNL